MRSSNGAVAGLLEPETAPELAAAEAVDDDDDWGDFEGDAELAAPTSTSQPLAADLFSEPGDEPIIDGASLSGHKCYY